MPDALPFPKTLPQFAGSSPLMLSLRHSPDISAIMPQAMPDPMYSGSTRPGFVSSIVKALGSSAIRNAFGGPPAAPTGGFEAPVSRFAGVTGFSSGARNAQNMMQNYVPPGLLSALTRMNPNMGQAADVIRDPEVMATLLRGPQMVSGMVPYL